MTLSELFQEFKLQYGKAFPDNPEYTLKHTRDGVYELYMGERVISHHDIHELLKIGLKFLNSINSELA